MRGTCPKCGKKLEISNEQLVSNDGVIVCPQCLLQARQPVPTARVAARYDEVDAATTPPHRKSSNSETTPPPHKPRMKQAKTSYRYTGLSGDSSSSSTPKKKTTAKKKSKKKKQNQGRTIIFTLVLFAAYVFFGLLLESLQ